MNTTAVESKFAEMGARLKVREFPSTWNWRSGQILKAGDYSVDIRKDNRGPFFEVLVPEHLREEIEISVVQSEPKERHLLLFVRKGASEPQLDRFLCGHDEREWFVAAVPGGASSVRQALAALQPGDVRDALARHRVSSRKRYARKNRAFRRQGEWFFVPEPSLAVPKEFILRKEPLRRGGGKPHIVEEIYRTGGETVYVSTRYPNGIPTKAYHELMRANPQAARWGWRVMQRNPGVYARGTVRHSDHDTITLLEWHRVVMNTENQSRTMANVAFLD